MKMQTRKQQTLLRIKEELISRYGNKCGYCGIEPSFAEILTVDCYLPFSSHKNMEEDNLVLACRACNAIKGNIEPIEESGKVRILHPYKSNYWSEIKIGKDGLAYGLTESGESTILLMHLNRPELIEYRVNNIGDFIKRINDKYDAYEIYIHSIGQISKLLKEEIENPELSEYLYRMIYANIIAAMEAYLSKILAAAVLNDETIFWRFVNKINWNNQKVSMKDIKETYDNMNIKVQEKLNELIFHNLPKVKKIYKDVLEIDILEDGMLECLSKAVNIRHDIVHRNGRKNKSEENEFHNITVDMITDLIEKVDQLVENIEGKRCQFSL